ncbi:aminoglycoside adenylyltransferase domain-containing protein [Shewanella algae]|uniref:aminoglycoside adenylyltransferase domain-containing protein n=1 Tax=Shewanella algae TaxID=38313 RepID=UPI00399AA039
MDDRSDQRYAPKDAAAYWAENQVPPPHRMLLKYAREGYLGMIEDRWGNLGDFEALVSYMKSSIEEYLDAP